MPIDLGETAKPRKTPPRRERYDWTPPRVMPAGWKVIERRLDGIAVQRSDGLAVIMSSHEESDSRNWLHVSLSYAKRLPNYEDVKEVRALWTPRQLTALQVFPRLDEYVNVNPNVLHLWCCLDGDVTPDFTGGSGMI